MSNISGCENKDECTNAIGKNNIKNLDSCYNCSIVGNILTCGCCEITGKRNCKCIDEQDVLADDSCDKRNINNVIEYKKGKNEKKMTEVEIPKCENDLYEKIIENNKGSLVARCELEPLSVVVLVMTLLVGTVCCGLILHWCVLSTRYIFTDKGWMFVTWSYLAGFIFTISAILTKQFNINNIYLINIISFLILLILIIASSNDFNEIENERKEARKKQNEITRKRDEDEFKRLFPDDFKKYMEDKRNKRDTPAKPATQVSQVQSVISSGGKKRIIKSGRKRTRKSGR